MHCWPMRPHNLHTCDDNFHVLEIPTKTKKAFFSQAHLFHNENVVAQYCRVGDELLVVVGDKFC